MKSTGIVRNVDELGRIVVPKEMRKRMGIASNDPVEIYVDGDKIILVKCQKTCVFCGSGEEVRDFRGKKVCAECVSALCEK